MAQLTKSGADHISASVADAPLPPVPLHRFAAALAAEVSRPLLLALGMLTRSTRHAAEPAHASWHGLTPRDEPLVEFRFVISSQVRSSDRRFVTVDCPSEGPTRRFVGQACFCMAARWFRRALVLFPLARFVGKLEDDASLHIGRLLLELQWGRALPSPTPTSRASATWRASSPASRVLDTTLGPALTWLGHFQWGVHDGRRGSYCGGEEQLLPRRPSSLQWCRPSWPSNNSLIAPFASGALDVRSRALVQHFVACEYVWEYLANWETEQNLACDGGMGHFVALCVREPITALHLPKAKLHGVPADHVAGPHCTVIHPNKALARVRWPQGGRAAPPAMLPIPFTILPPTGVGTHATWVATNESLVRAYQHYRKRGLDDRLCDAVPCAALHSAV